MLRIGIAGIGYIAETYIKLQAERKIKGCVICAICSRNREHMQEVQSRYKLDNAELYTDYGVMLDSGRIDAVLICTPHRMHIKMAREALDRGIHALVEKPVGVCIDEGEELLHTVHLHPELTAGVLYCRRTSKAYGELRRMISGGELGAIKRVNWLITNLYRTQAYHRMDLLVWLMGMPGQVQGFCGYGIEREIEVENEVLLQMWYPGNTTVQFIASSREFPGTNRIEISGC